MAVVLENADDMAMADEEELRYGFDETNPHPCIQRYSIFNVIVDNATTALLDLLELATTDQRQHLYHHHCLRLLHEGESER